MKGVLILSLTFKAEVSPEMKAGEERPASPLHGPRPDRHLHRDQKMLRHVD